MHIQLTVQAQQDSILGHTPWPANHNDWKFWTSMKTCWWLNHWQWRSVLDVTVLGGNGQICFALHSCTFWQNTPGGPKITSTLKVSAGEYKRWGKGPILQTGLPTVFVGVRCLCVRCTGEQFPAKRLVCTAKGVPGMLNLTIHWLRHSSYLCSWRDARCSAKLGDPKLEIHWILG